MNVRTALLGLFVALTIVLASTTVYESGARTTFTSTSTSTSTMTQITTVTSTTQVTTAQISYFLLGNTALVLNSSDGLGLSMQAEQGPNGNYTFTVRESNLLNSVNNVTEVDGWAYHQDSEGACGPDPFTNPVELAVVPGHYGQNNYTSGSAVPFFNPSIIEPCGKVGFLGGPYAFGFQPLNDAFSFPSGSAQAEVGAASVTITTNGYWTVDQNGVAAPIPFPPGPYTVIGADEWGDVVLLQAFLE